MDWEFILTNIILPLVVTFVGAYAYPRIEFYLKNRSLSSRQRKIVALIREYKKRKKSSENLELLTVLAIRDIAQNIRATAMGLAVSIILYFLVNHFLVSSPLGRLTYIIVAVVGTAFAIYDIFSDTVNLINDSLAFHHYRPRAVTRMQMLGGNPDDLEGRTETTANVLKS